MITTGQTIYNDFYRLVGMNYTGYLSPVQLSLELERAFIQAMYDIFISGNQTTTSKDRLNSLVRSNYVFPVVNNNQIYLEPLGIGGVVNVSGTNWTVTTFLQHNIIQGQTVIIQGIAGFTNNPNGTFLVTGATVQSISFTATASGGGSYASNTGNIVLQGGQVYIGTSSTSFVNDYWRFLAVKAQYFTPLSLPFNVRKWSPVTLGISSMTGNNVPVVITMNYYSNLRSEDNINISSVGGNTNANGSFYIKQLNDIQFALYSDKYCQNAVIGNGGYIAGTGIISRIYYKYCTPYLSDEKINSLNKPSPENPRYELANGCIIFYPQDVKVNEITMDYIGKPYPIYSSGYLIDCTDNIINLENYYPKDFLTLITNVAANTFLAELRDVDGLQLTENTQQR